MTLPQKAVVLALMLLNAPLPSLPARLAGDAMTQLCSGVLGRSFLSLLPSLELVLVLGLLFPPFNGVVGTGGTTSWREF